MLVVGYGIQESKIQITNTESTSNRLLPRQKG